MGEQPASRYDRQRQRRFEFIPLWGIKVFLLYAPRRVDCRSCGVKVEHMPWAVGKRQITRNYAWYLAEWSKRMSWQEVAEAFRTSWHHVFCSVEMAVIWGRERQDLSGIKSIGIDEIQWQKGHKYLTVVYQIDQDRKRLLWVGQHRKAKTLLYFFGWVAKTLRNHRLLLLNWLKAKGQISSGVVEGFNNKAELTMRRSYGFRTFRGLEIALYHAMRDLVEPKLTHRFF